MLLAFDWFELVTAEVFWSTGDGTNSETLFFSSSPAVLINTLPTKGEIKTNCYADCWDLNVEMWPLILHSCNSNLLQMRFYDL